MARLRPPSPRKLWRDEASWYCRFPTSTTDETPAEAPNMMKTLERAVEHVAGLGCLDRDRLGITGFSRTGFYVHYMLAH
jgi:dienelactone hydrolase